MRARKGQQEPRLQVSTALKKSDYEELHLTQEKHGVSLSDIIREGISSYNRKVFISDIEMMKIIREGIKAVNQEKLDENKIEIKEINNPVNSSTNI